MPARVPRSLKGEITVSLVIKTAALLVIGLALFGPEDRVRPTEESMETRLVGDSR